MVNVTGSDESWFRLVSLPALQVRSPLNWAPWMILWMEMMLGMSMMVTLVSSTSGVTMGVFDVCLVHQTTWICCPYSWFPSGKTRIWPCWADGLERKCLWAVSSFFHWMVLKGGAIMTHGLQMSSVPSVDSAIGAWIM